MRALDVPDPALRRAEAGAFLRSRRERLTPADVGLPDGFRRRTPGLRREEVAMLSGVGATWYTWLEQGRDVHPSDTVLAAIADVLRLDFAERCHLFLLHDRAAPERPAVLPQRVTEPLRRMLDSMAEQPALVLGRQWNILAWNRAADAVFGPYAHLAGEERNSLYLMFAAPEHRKLLVDWEAIARPTLAMFRADSVRHASDPSFERLVVKLMAISPEFAQWWPAREVAAPLAGCKRIDHPVAGRMDFEFSSFSVNGADDMKLLVFTPLEAEQTCDKVKQLVRAGSPPGEAAGVADVPGVRTIQP